MQHQDWNTIYVRANDVITSKKISEKKSTESKFLKENKMEKKIEEGNLKHDKVKLDIGKQIQAKRLELGLTQKDLANKINIPVKTINEIESGKANKNQQLINKIKRFLKISNK
jgi:ribosome-binding protein aMBF1 (putative translation factor)